MTMVHAHGQEQSWFGVPGHNFYTENPEGYSTAKLQEFSEAVVKKGATSSLIDLSCYSGATQKKEGLRSIDSTEKVASYCIATLAADNYVSICSTRGRQGSFTEGFISQLEGTQAPDLETAVMNARSTDETPNNFPEISSLTQPMKREWLHFFHSCDPASYGISQTFVKLSPQSR